MRAGRDAPKRGCISSIINPVKFTFFVMNIVFFIVGITALAIGGVALFDKDRILAFAALDDTGPTTNVNVAAFLENLAMGMMASGGALLFVGCLGCWGVAIGISCCLYLYCLIFALMVAAQLALFGYVYLQKDNIQIQLKTMLNDAVMDFKGDDVSTASKSEVALNLIQKYLKCCGAEGGFDYRRSPWYSSPKRQNGQLVPVTCCKLKDVDRELPSDSQCQITRIGPENPYTNNGCVATVESYVYSVTVSGVILWVVVVTLQLLALCYAAIIERGFSDYDLALKLNPGGMSHRPSNAL